MAPGRWTSRIFKDSSNFSDQDVPLLVIGPTPFGNGVVNAADLDVLMGYRCLSKKVITVVQQG